MEKNKLVYLPVTGIKDDMSDLGYVVYYIVSAEERRDGEHIGNDVIRLFPNEEFGIQDAFKRHLPRDPSKVTTGIAKYRDGLIPKQVHEDLASGKCKYLILDYSMEGYNDVDWDYISEIMGVEKSKIVWITGIWNPEFMNRQSEISVCFTNYWELFTFHITKLTYSPRDRKMESSPWNNGFEQQLKDIDDKKKRKYHALSYNRQPRWYRAILLTRLKEAGLLTNTSYSWGKWATIYGEENYGKNKDNDKKRLKLERENFLQRFESSKHLGLLRKQDWDAWNDIMSSDEVRISDDEDLNINKAFDINFNHVKDCYFQIISETWVPNSHVDDATPFLSEKSYKPFICAMPFVTWAQKGTIEALREHGYNVFDNWINHDYDKIVDDGERLDALMEEIQRLNNKTHDDWTSMLQYMKPALIGNYQIIWNRTQYSSRFAYRYDNFIEVTSGIKKIDWYNR